MNKYDPLFAKYYDLLVHDRQEAVATTEDMDFLKGAFASNSAREVKDILDVGCGTGRYLIPLAAHGFHVTGIDNSPEMLAQCEERLRKRGLTARLVEADLTQFSESDNYDVVICMNSVICYLLDRDAIISALSSFHNALRPGGLLVLEIWNILANCASSGSTNVYEVFEGAVKIRNTQSSRYDSFHSIYHGKLDVTVEDAGAEHSFSHEEVLRVMTVGEVTCYLEEAGFTDSSVHLRQDTLEPESGDEEIILLASKP